ncbi:MAG: Dihydroorotase [Firmicutes bacterium]|nr:Dihydroorotase [Bacillota bacterium]
MDTLITGARLLDPANNVDIHADVLVSGERIVAIGYNLPFVGNNCIDARDKVLIPGLVDIHVHLREPGREHKETIQSGGRAAAAGGYTAVCAMPNTWPPLDNAEILRYFANKASHAPVRCYPIATITKGQRGQELTPVLDLMAAGAVAFSDDGEPVSEAFVFREALQQSRIHHLPVIAHCEDKRLSAQGVMHEGERSALLSLKGIPAAAEESMVARDLELAKETGGRLHIAHVSTALSIQMIREAKTSGIPVTCEVTPHHLLLTDEFVTPTDTNSKMNPPLRTAQDVHALRLALKDNVIDCIATDHAPHHAAEKALPYQDAPFGIVGLETALPLLITHLVNTGVLALPELVQLMSSNPAGILNLPRGEIVPGGLADLTLVDLHAPKTVTPDNFYSLGQNTPFAGLTLWGWPVMTMVNGKIVMRDGVVYE